MYFTKGGASVSGVLGLLWLLVRWLLVVAAAYIGFYVAALPGALAYSALLDWCPWAEPEFFAARSRGESVICPIPGWVEGVLYSVFASLAAVAVVLFGTIAAPIRRTWLPWVVYLGGASVAAYLVARLVEPMPYEADLAAYDRALSQRIAAEYDRRRRRDIVAAGFSFVAGALTAGILARRIRRASHKES